MLWLVSGEFYHKPIRVLSVFDVYFGSCWMHTLRPYSTAWLDLEPIWCMLFSKISIRLSHSMWRVLVIRCLHVRFIISEPTKSFWERLFLCFVAVFCLDALVADWFGRIEANADLLTTKIRSLHRFFCLELTLFNGAACLWLMSIYQLDLVHGATVFADTSIT